MVHLLNQLNNGKSGFPLSRAGACRGRLFVHHFTIRSRKENLNDSQPPLSGGRTHRHDGAQEIVTSDRASPVLQSTDCDLQWMLWRLGTAFGISGPPRNGSAMPRSSQSYWKQKGPAPATVGRLFEYPERPWTLYFVKVTIAVCLHCY